MASPLIYPKFQGIAPSTTGAAAAGFKLKTFAAGTATPLATYTDATLAVANPTTVVMDANGEANVWLGQLAYKFVFTDPSDVVQWTADNVSQASLGQTQNEWIPLPAPTFISNTVFSVGGGVTDLTITPYFFTIGTRVKTVNTGGTVYSTVTGVTGNQVTVKNDSGVIDAGISSASYGILVNGPNPSAAYRTLVGLQSGSNVNLVNAVATSLNVGGTLAVDHLNESTAAGQVTIKSAGVYRIFGHVLFNEGGATTGIQNVAQLVAVRKNSSAVISTTINWPIAASIASSQAIPFHGYLSLIPGDFIDVAVTAGFTGTAPTASLAAFTIERVL
jgi:hypothetical protein